MRGQGNHWRRPWFFCAALLMLCGVTGLGLSWFAYAATPTAAKPSADTTLASLAPVFPAASGDHCVADTDLMRTDHMKLLNHQRDETVIEGKRDNPFSLVGCVDCHAQTASDGTAIRIDAEGQFCESCHRYAAVKIDCFSCHAAVPEKDTVIGRQNRDESTLAEFQSNSMLPVSLHTPITRAQHQNTHGKLNERVTAD